MRCLDQGFAIAADVRGCILDDNPHDVHVGPIGSKERRAKETEKAKKGKDEFHERD